MERCPTCRARLKGAAICPRCQTDLSHVIKTSERSDLLCQYAINKLRQNDIKLAVVLIKESVQLQRSTLSLKVQQFILQLLEQRTVSYLHHGKLDLAQETLDLALILKKTPIILALHGFIKQQCRS